MAKRTGLGSRFFVGGYDLSGDTNALSKIGGGSALIDVSAINGAAFERLGGKRDGSIDFTVVFNDSAGASHAVLSALPTTDVTAIYASAATVGAPGSAVVGKQDNYPLANATDGALTAAVSVMSSNGAGVHHGQMLTAGLRTESTATNGASIDTGASVSFGATLFLVCTALGSGTPTIKLQDSADDSTFADVTGATFGTVAALDNEMVQTSSTQAVRRYIRIATTGTFAGLSFAVLINKHLTATI